MKKSLAFLILLNLFLNNLILSQQKIVSLTPSITESLYLLGEQKSVLGITTFCKKYSKNQKVVGTYLDPNIEEIIKINPDFVFISKEGAKKEIVEKLKKFNITTIVFEPANNYQEIKLQFLEIAKFVKKEELAKNIIKEYEEKLKKLKIHSNKKSVICIISLQPLIVASENSYIGDIINSSGGINLIKSKLKYPQINFEEIIKLNPEVIILTDMGITKHEIKSFLKNFETITAVKKNKVYFLESDLLCQPNIKNYYYSVKKINEIIKN
ncbi:MAG: ABC transporter substrate-binding protein [Endomicrobiia bacterium]